MCGGILGVYQKIFNMNQGFWSSLPRPFFVLAPMYDVTDVAFRQVVVQCGRPHVFVTEFVSADGLCSEEGFRRLSHHLRFQKKERPIVAQIFGSNPENFYKAAQLLADLNFDGVDINLGCPDKNIMKQGSCAALFKNPKLTQEIILATKEGGRSLPVSVKIRIGDTKIDWQGWVESLLKTKPAVISVHLRTRKEMSKVPAHWEEMGKIVEFIRQNCAVDERPLLVGNGDVLNLSDARVKAERSGCDGVMLGRAIFQNPWLFSELHGGTDNHSKDELIHLMLRHAQIFEQNFAGIKSFEVFKRFIKIYVSGFDGAAELREALYKAKNASELESISFAGIK